MNSLNEQINHQMWSEVPDGAMIWEVSYKVGTAVKADFIYQIMEQILNKVRDDV